MAADAPAGRMHEADVPAHAPDHEMSAELASGVAVSVTTLDWSNEALQVDPQLTPAGEETMLPVPLPELVTVTLRVFGAGGVDVEDLHAPIENAVTANSAASLEVGFMFPESSASGEDPPGHFRPDRRFGSRPGRLGRGRSSGVSGSMAGGSTLRHDRRWWRSRRPSKAGLGLRSAGDGALCACGQGGEPSHGRMARRPRFEVVGAHRGAHEPRRESTCHRVPDNVAPRGAPSGSPLGTAMRS